MAWWDHGQYFKPKEIDWESEEMKSVAERVDQLIQQNPVMIFSKSYCPYCHKVKSVFKRRDIPYEALETEDDP
jgi:glutaredoxin 3